MKLLKWIIPICLIWLVPMVTYGAEFADINNVYEAIDFIKSKVNIGEITIKTAMPYDVLQDVIEKYCPKTEIDKAKEEVASLNELLSSFQSKQNIDNTLIERFNLVKWLIVEQKRDSLNKYCKDNYLLFSMLKTTQDLYSGEKDVKVKKTSKTNTNSTKTVQTNTNTSSSTKTAIHWSATNEIKFNFNHDTSWLPRDAKQSFSATTEKYLQDILADLVNINILDENDLKIMNNKIKVTYQQSCEVTEWAFRVMRNKQTWKVTFKEIELIIAYCDKNNTPERQKRHVQQILAHELGHYIYFFKDENPSKFSEICWDNWKMNCLPKEFVSTYATKSLEEDYAESFAYWYLYNTDSNDWDGHGSAPDNPINRRARYFEELFEKEEEEDDEDEEQKKIS